MDTKLLRLFFLLVNSGALYAYYEFRTNAPPRINVRTVKTAHKAVRKTCFLYPDKGPCRGDIPMYYHDADAGNCSTFRWGGCQGNGNRFDSFQECRDHCLKPDFSDGRPEYCHLAFDYGYCFGAVERYYYDRLYKVCKKALYSGCGGNKNNFIMMEQCVNICTFGNGPLPNRTPRTFASGIKKILVINPNEAVSKRHHRSSVVRCNTSSTLYTPPTHTPRANTPLGITSSPITQNANTAILKP